MLLVYSVDEVLDVYKCTYPLPFDPAMHKCDDPDVVNCSDASSLHKNLIICILLKIQITTEYTK